MKVYLLLGSNVGDKRANILKAIEQLKREGLNVLMVSEIIETEPEDCPPQEKFLNAGVICETSLSPQELLQVICNIEKMFGRDKKGEKAPRTIDIDIAFYGEKVFISEELEIPHPRLHTRFFALKILNELCPHFLHPLTGKTVSEHFEDISNHLKKRRKGIYN